jgi:hypothetical protein
VINSLIKVVLAFEGDQVLPGERQGEHVLKEFVLMEGGAGVQFLDGPGLELLGQLLEYGHAQAVEGLATLEEEDVEQAEENGLGEMLGEHGQQPGGREEHQVHRLQGLGRPGPAALEQHPEHVVVHSDALWLQVESLYEIQLHEVVGHPPGVILAQPLHEPVHPEVHALTISDFREVKGDADQHPFKGQQQGRGRGLLGKGPPYVLPDL